MSADCFRKSSFRRWIIGFRRKHEINQIIANRKTIRGARLINKFVSAQAFRLVDMTRLNILLPQPEPAPYKVNLVGTPNRPEESVVENIQMIELHISIKRKLSQNTFRTDESFDSFDMCNSF